MAQIDVNSLEAADIITFDGEKDDVLSQLICLLTDSEVSHSAIFIQQNPALLADAGLVGLALHQVADVGDPLRVVHIGRLNNATSVNRLPITDIARKYAAEDLVYPMPDLIMVGLILIYKNFSKAGLRQSLVIAFLKAATVFISHILDEKKYQGKHPMTCSEFVYHCYAEASSSNPDLALHLKDADLRRGFPSREVSLVDHLKSYSQTRGFSLETPLLNNNLDESDDDIIDPMEAAKNLLTSLKTKNSDFEDRSFYADNEHLSLAVRNFLTAYNKLCSISPARNLGGLLADSYAAQAMFVTPNDLLNHITNVNNLGKFPIYRDPKKY